MLVMCSILLTINVGGVGVMSRADVEGKLLKEDQFKYLVDFSEGIKRFDVKDNVLDYKKKIVNKDDCIKE